MNKNVPSLVEIFTFCKDMFPNIIFFSQEIVSGHLGVDGQNVLRAVGVELDSEQGGWQDKQKMVARDVLDQVGQEDHVL